MTILAWSEGPHSFAVPIAEVGGPYVYIRSSSDQYDRAVAVIVAREGYACDRSEVFPIAPNISGLS